MHICVFDVKYFSVFKTVAVIFVYVFRMFTCTCTVGVFFSSEWQLLTHSDYTLAVITFVIYSWSQLKQMIDSSSLVKELLLFVDNWVKPYFWSHVYCNTYACTKRSPSLLVSLLLPSSSLHNTNVIDFLSEELSYTKLFFAVTVSILSPLCLLVFEYPKTKITGWCW